MWVILKTLFLDEITNNLNENKIYKKKMFLTN